MSALHGRSESRDACFRASIRETQTTTQEALHIVRTNEAYGRSSGG